MGSIQIQKKVIMKTKKADWSDNVFKPFKARSIKKRVSIFKRKEIAGERLKPLKITTIYPN